MTNEELLRLVHLLLMCGVMDKTALESGNIDIFGTSKRFVRESEG